ncbi:hypothetical protein D051_2020 [Vibrio parahaemolyticus VPCR-2010]|nr:hypothetical protein Vp2S01_2755 [Vibrio parahaemolyticus]EQM36655.1 hypothetical protein D051_2020 [Vibrio parahaemolyticus VPCR-2010]
MQRDTLFAHKTLKTKCLVKLIAKRPLISSFNPQNANIAQTFTL